MIRTLQKKFVMTAMAAITVLIVFMLGAINIANMVIVGGQIDRTLRVVAEHEGGADCCPSRTPVCPGPSWTRRKTTTTPSCPPISSWSGSIAVAQSSPWM